MHCKLFNIHTMKIKIGSRLSSLFRPRHYKLFHNQDLPKPQVNCNYFVYDSNKWIHLYYHNNQFYEVLYNNIVDSFWLLFYTQSETEILKGSSLQGVPSVYLNAYGRRLAWAYNKLLKNKALQKEARFHIFKVRKRLK